MAEKGITPASIATHGLWALVFLWTPVVDAGDLYRWVDERGEIHYTDAPPPESARSSDRDGEQGKADAAARGREDNNTAERAEQSRRDHILWQSYSSVADIERTRERRLEAVDGEIGLGEHRVKQARQQIERYGRLLEDLPEDSEHRATMEQQRVESRARLQQRLQELERARAKRERVEARFARDIERFRELQADRE